MTEPSLPEGLLEALAREKAADIASLAAQAVRGRAALSARRRWYRCRLPRCRTSCTP